MYKHREGDGVFGKSAKTRSSGQTLGLYYIFSEFY